MTQYHFLGNGRLQLWFASPNLCGAFLAMLLFVLAGIWLWSLNRSGRGMFVLALLSVLGIMMTELGIAWTYSRGAYVAVIITIALWSILFREKRLAAIGVVFLLALWCTSDGLLRLSSTAGITDPAVGNRLHLWRGGAGIIAQHPWFGVGLDHIGRWYHTWYQPLAIREYYRTLISDYLSVAAGFGLPVLIALLATISGITCYGIHIACLRKNGLLTGLTGAVVCYCICAVFSTLFQTILLSGSLFFILGTVLIYSMRLASIHHLQRNGIIWRSAVASAFLAAVIILLWGRWENRRFPGRVLSMQNYDERSGSSAEGALICIFHAQEEAGGPPFALRRFLRQTDPRHHLVLLRVNDSGMQGLERCLKTVSDLATSHHRKVVLAGTGCAGRNAVLTAIKYPEHVMAVIAWNIPTTWPFRELSIQARQDALSVPLFLYSGTGTSNIDHPLMFEFPMQSGWSFREYIARHDVILKFYR